jgi:hypothetical protein
MPRISFFYGISIYMYWDETHHRRPHFHASYAGQEAVFDTDGDLVRGSLPPHARSRVRAWAGLHRPELDANWDRARRGESLEQIAPLA